MCFGIPIGSEAFITHKLQEQAQEIIADAEKAREMLSSNYQSLWTALRLSISTRFQYWMQLTPPSLCEPVARGLDNALWTILEAACGFKVPRGEEEGGLTPNGGRLNDAGEWLSGLSLLFLARP